MMITASEALELLKHQVEKKGEDYVYKAEERDAGDPTPMCEYFDETGQPSCIVGWVFDELGLKTPYDFNTNNTTVREVVNLNFPDKFESGAVTVLNVAQNAQDSGRKWGTALSEAERVAKLLTKIGSSDA